MYEHSDLLGAVLESLELLGGGAVMRKRATEDRLRSLPTQAHSLFSLCLLGSMNSERLGSYSIPRSCLNYTSSSVMTLDWLQILSSG